MPLIDSRDVEPTQKVLEAVYAGATKTPKERDQKQQANALEKIKNIPDLQFSLFAEFTRDGIVAVSPHSLLHHIINAYNKPVLNWCLDQSEAKGEKQAFVNFFMPGEVHPLYMAAKVGSAEMVEILLNNGANVDLLVINTNETAVQKMLAGRGEKNNKEDFTKKKDDVYGAIATVAEAIAQDSQISTNIKKLVAKAKKQKDSKASNSPNGDLIHFNNSTISFNHFEHNKSSTNKQDHQKLPGRS